jgi:hypothetical protein
MRRRRFRSFPDTLPQALPLRGVRPRVIVLGLNTASTQQVRYPYEEFAEHVRAMRTVCQWEYTSRFGYLGGAQTNESNNKRVVEYFADSYTDFKEAIRKAEVFLSIYDYLGRHAALFCRKALMETVEGGSFLVEPTLLRAIHYVFTVTTRPERLDPKKVLSLARAFQGIDAGPC